MPSTCLHSNHILHSVRAIETIQTIRSDCSWLCSENNQQKSIKKPAIKSTTMEKITSGPAFRISTAHQLKPLVSNFCKDLNYCLLILRVLFFPQFYAKVRSLHEPKSFYRLISGPLQEKKPNSSTCFFRDSRNLLKYFRLPPRHSAW